MRCVRLLPCAWIASTTLCHSVFRVLLSVECSTRVSLICPLCGLPSAAACPARRCCSSFFQRRAQRISSSLFKSRSPLPRSRPVLALSHRTAPTSHRRFSVQSVPISSNLFACGPLTLPLRWCLCPFFGKIENAEPASPFKKFLFS
ncbi:hypothetical protein TRVL_07830 [Trypanosoma vivax]|nr:hypothetical protein TRVL_07830 [Trypanosoma vivax]